MDLLQKNKGNFTNKKWLKGVSKIIHCIFNTKWELFLIDNLHIISENYIVNLLLNRAPSQNYM